ncbi:MAG: hypothetical protein JO117_00175, partial [Verrucomicrobia bacterium]|nr:hypothetical protein [Verrucomicrobiota bacterium]
DPQTARWYFYLAQALRRSGNLQEALVRMRQASERAEEPQQAEFFQFIVRLTQIELGQVNELLTETAAKLQSPAPPADWVLTAAAIDLQRGQPEQAAKLLSQVFQQQPASYAAARLDDVFFRNYATVREMAPLYAKYLPEGAGVVPADAARTVKPPAVSLLPPGATSPGPLLNPLPTPPPAPSNSPAAEPAAQEGAPNNAR